MNANIKSPRKTNENPSFVDSSSDEKASDPSFAIMAASSRSMSVDDPVRCAVAMLLNNRTVHSTETKSGVSVKYEYPQALLAIAKGLFNPNKVYNFRLHNSTSLTSTGAGLYNQCISFANYGSTALEWSALASLFEQCRLRRYRLIITSLALSTVSHGQIVIGYNPTNVSAVTTGFSLTSRLPKTSYIHSYLSTGGSGTKIFSGAPIKLDYSQTSSTPYTVSPPSGLLGSVDFASANALANSTVYHAVEVMLDVAFKSRA